MSTVLNQHGFEAGAGSFYRSLDIRKRWLKGCGITSGVTEGWLEIDKHYSLELCFSIVTKMPTGRNV